MSRRSVEIKRKMVQYANKRDLDLRKPENKNEAKEAVTRPGKLLKKKQK